MSGHSPDTRLVGDIGGTNTRLALYDPASGELSSVSYYTNRDFEQFEQVIDSWFESLNAPRPRTACLAVAAPPTGDHVTMLNMNWSFSVSELERRFDLDRLLCINDFEANAHALPHLPTQELFTLSVGQPQSGNVLATVGPGTGLGGASLIVGSQHNQACASEPGHMGLSPGNELELALFRALLRQHRDIYAELLLSGPGMARLYQTMAKVEDKPVQDLAPADISRLALAGECPICVKTVNVFCNLLGSACGDFVLANGAYGGLYLAGGIVPAILPILAQSGFNSRFAQKGEMEYILADVPRFAITGTTTGLLGAAHAPLGGP